MTTDEMISEMRQLLALDSNPWRVNTMDQVGRDWLIADFGRDRSDVKWILTTDGVHASERRGTAESDARFCVLARQLMPELLRKLK